MCLLSLRLRLPLVAVLIGSLWVHVHPLTAQESSSSETVNSPFKKDPLWIPEVVRDPKALEVVEASIRAMGGAAAISQVQSYVVRADFADSAGTTEPHNGTITWTVAGKETRVEYLGRKGATVAATGRGTPFRTVDGVTKRASALAVRTELIPPLVAPALLKQLQDKEYSLEYQGTSEVAGRQVAVVKTVSQSSRLEALITPQKWYFDLATNLPLRVDHQVVDKVYSHRQTTTSIELSTYRAVAGVLIPHQIVRRTGRRVIGVLMVTAVEQNVQVPAYVFDAPAGGVQ